MPNATLTLVSEKPSTNGWSFVDADGKDYWVPPTQRDTNVSNEPVAADLRANLGKPLELATWEKEGGTLRIIFGRAQARKGGGGVTAWRNTREGQVFEQHAMNRRTALMQAVTLYSSQEKTDGQVSPAVIGIADRLFAWLEGSAETAGGGTGLGKAESSVSVSAEHHLGAGEVAAPSRGGSKPAPAPGQLTGLASAEQWDRALDLFGSHTRVLDAFRKQRGTNVEAEDITAQEMAELIMEKLS
jgi:hypothetical protein